MTIYVFGNPDLPDDNSAFIVIHKLEQAFPEIEFKEVYPNQDIPSENQTVTLIDTVMGITTPTLLTETDLKNIVLSPRTSAHDYDLNFQLKYLVKIGRLKKIQIVGIPANQQIDYDSIQSILRKLVAQDIQGS